MKNYNTKNHIEQINHLCKKGKINNKERLVLLNSFRAAIDSIAHGDDYPVSLIVDIIDPEIRSK